MNVYISKTICIFYFIQVIRCIWNKNLAQLVVLLLMRLMRKQQDGITTVFISQNAKSYGVIPKTKVEEEGDKMGVCSTPPPPGKGSGYNQCSREERIDLENRKKDCSNNRLYMLQQYDYMYAYIAYIKLNSYLNYV